MPESEPLTDSYIDGIVKASQPVNPGATKTQGAGLRELFKTLRDRSEEISEKNGRPLSTTYFRINEPGSSLQVDDLINAESLTVSRGVPVEVILSGNPLSDQALFDPSLGRLTFGADLFPGELIPVTFVAAWLGYSGSGLPGDLPLPLNP